MKKDLALIAGVLIAFVIVFSIANNSSATGKVTQIQKTEAPDSTDQGRNS